MTLEKKIDDEYKSALKAGDKLKVSTLRMLRSEINNLRLDKNKKELADADIIKILKRFLNEEVSEIQAARMMNDEVDALQQ